MDVTATSLEEKVSKPLKIAMALHASWNGQGGKTIFFQNEMPYDVPNQASWNRPSGR